MEARQDAVVAGTSPDIDRHELIRRRAEDIYIRSGRIPGRDIENWTQAEEEIRAEFERASCPTAIIVRLSGFSMSANTLVKRLMDTHPENSNPEHRFPFVWTARRCL